MSITVHFLNANEDADKVRVYKSESPFTVTELPPVYDTTVGDATSYTDTDVVPGSVYYYMFETVRGNSTVFSVLLEAKAESTATGPGPQRPIAVEDDYSAGFFGEVQHTEFIDGPTLARAIGLEVGTPINNDSAWLKYYLRDRILFVAKRPLRRALSWSQINEVGAVYGGPDDATVTINNYNFKVRLLTGGNADPASGPGGEWDDLIYPVWVNDPNGRYWASYTGAELGFVASRGQISWCQETDVSGPKYRLSRGGINTPVNISGIDATRINTGDGWRPVLELIP